MLTEATWSDDDLKVGLYIKWKRKGSRLSATGKIYELTNDGVIAEYHLHNQSRRVKVEKNRILTISSVPIHG